MKYVHDQRRLVRPKRQKPLTITWKTEIAKTPEAPPTEEFGINLLSALQQF